MAAHAASLACFHKTVGCSVQEALLDSGIKSLVCHSSNKVHTQRQ